MSEPGKNNIQRIAVYGKGGIGKSVVATNLSACFAMKSLRVLHVGCDPKSDSAVRLMAAHAKVRTVLDVLGDDPSAVSAEHIIQTGRLGIDCCESGGPPPGLGCGGRGVARTLEFLGDLGVLESGRYDAAVFDVLGDVVCGGFAAPLRKGLGDKIVIVLCEEPMAMYAANNISRAVQVYGGNGVVLAGLVANLRDNRAESREMIEAFAQRLSTRLLGVIPRDAAVLEAERKRMTVVEYAPEAPAAVALRNLADELVSVESSGTRPPTPIEDEDFYRFLEQW